MVNVIVAVMVHCIRWHHLDGKGLGLGLGQLAGGQVRRESMVDTVAHGGRGQLRGPGGLGRDPLA